MSQHKSIKLIFSILIALFTILELIKDFSWDELEHIHSSYLVSQGFIPYISFFQHHHPLTWYVYAPIFLVAGTGTLALVIIKLVSIVFGLVNLYLLFKISAFYFDSLNYPLAAIIVCFTSIVFLLTGVGVRPDVLMMTFILSSFYYLLRYFKHGFSRYLFFSGILLGFSFLVLQKSIFFIFAFPFILFVEEVLIQRTLSIKTIKMLSLFVLSIAIPIGIFFLLIFVNGYWEKYYFFNWTLNFNFEDKFSFIRSLIELNLFDLGFFVFYAISLIYILAKPKLLKKQNIRIILLLNIFSILSVITVRSPYLQYFLPLLSFGSILIIIFVKDLNRALSKKVNSNVLFFVLCSLLFVSSLPLYFFKPFYIKDGVLDKQIQKINAVSQVSQQEKQNLKVQQDKNIFFTDHGFYWFSPEAEVTIKKLEKEGKVPKEIEIPK